MTQSLRGRKHSASIKQLTPITNPTLTLEAGVGCPCPRPSVMGPVPSMDPPVPGQPRGQLCLCWQSSARLSPPKARGFWRCRGRMSCQRGLGSTAPLPHGEGKGPRRRHAGSLPEPRCTQQGCPCLRLPRQMEEDVRCPPGPCQGLAAASLPSRRALGARRMAAGAPVPREGQARQGRGARCKCAKPECGNLQVPTSKFFETSVTSPQLLLVPEHGIQMPGLGRVGPRGVKRPGR